MGPYSCFDHPGRPLIIALFGMASRVSKGLSNRWSSVHPSISTLELVCYNPIQPIGKGVSNTRPKTAQETEDNPASPGRRDQFGHHSQQGQMQRLLCQRRQE